MVVQSTSPYHAKRTFLSIGKTVSAAGFRKVKQYHANVPSFGEWGWTIAVPHGRPPEARITSFEGWAPANWATKEMVLAAFVFGRGFYKMRDAVRVNWLRSGVMYQYHLQDWDEVKPR